MFLLRIVCLKTCSLPAAKQWLSSLEKSVSINFLIVGNSEASLLFIESFGINYSWWPDGLVCMWLLKLEIRQIQPSWRWSLSELGKTDSYQIQLKVRSLLGKNQTQAGAELCQAQQA